MSLWQNAAKKPAKQSTAEYTREHNQADCNAPHLRPRSLTTFHSPTGQHYSSHCLDVATEIRMAMPQLEGNVGSER